MQIIKESNKYFRLLGSEVEAIDGIARFVKVDGLNKLVIDDLINEPTEFTADDRYDMQFAHIWYGGKRDTKSQFNDFIHDFELVVIGKLCALPKILTILKKLNAEINLFDLKSSDINKTYLGITDFDLAIQSYVIKYSITAKSNEFENQLLTLCKQC